LELLHSLKPKRRADDVKSGDPDDRSHGDESLQTLARKIAAMPYQEILALKSTCQWSTRDREFSTRKKPGFLGKVRASAQQFRSITRERVCRSVESTRVAFVEARIANVRRATKRSPGRRHSRSSCPELAARASMETHKPAADHCQSATGLAQGILGGRIGVNIGGFRSCSAKSGLPDKNVVPGSNNGAPTDLDLQA
jgi:hypothetical protein